jgi:ParB/RepB/Spo0J family partition protein
MKNSFVIDLKRIEIAHLDLKYLHTRIRNIAAAGRMSESMERFGQISPVIVVPAEPFGFTLMDGYIRVAALKRCAKDTVKAQVWQCSEQEAMLQVLARTQDRKWEVFEQAVLIQELKIHFQLSHGQIAGYLGKAKSFVTRRLALLDSLDDETREHIRAGTLSVWSATRVIVPLARANPQHAKILTDSLVKEAMSTREVATVFKHYRRSNRKTRMEIVSRPQLFLKVLEQQEAEAQGKQIGQGPEGKWVKDIQVVKHMLDRLEKDTALVMYQNQSQLDRRVLLTAFEQMRAAFFSLTDEIRRCDDTRARQANHIDAARQRNRHPKNKRPVGALKKNDPTGDTGCRGPQTGQALPIRSVGATGR